MNFVHLHNHTEYSLLDGGNRISSMVKRAKSFGMPALAISDHGVMFGAMEFYMECQKAGIKPIIGMEAYVASKGINNRSGRLENQTCHLLLLAKNLEGYKNLCKLHTYAALEGFYYKPRIDHELLRAHSKGLIATSSCLGSEICQELLRGDYHKAQYLAGAYKEIFDEGSFFIELQDHGIPEQKQVNEFLIKMSKELNLPLVATNDAHYLGREDAKAHDVLLCIGTGSLVNDQKRLKFATEEFYIKSAEEMQKLFAYAPEALENTLQIADMCNVELGKQQALMPDPELPHGHTSNSYLRYLSEEGLKQRVKNADSETYERLNYEISVIEKTGFESYMLLVREFAKFTREAGIMFGVRGSAAGSLISYCLGITDINPVEYDLTFERFLNIERIAMPDIDMDFEDARRDEVIQWVTQKYGTDRVAQIITFGTLGAKAAIRDSGRVMGYTPMETDRICKTIPNLPFMNIDRAMKESKDFKDLFQSDPKVSKLVEVAKSVEGLSRHAGVHAAGVVISKDPLMEQIPLYRGNDGQAITAYEMGILEKIGLLKMDFLGLSNLTVLARTVENIKHHRKVDLNIQDLPLDDEKTYDMLERGETMGVFQLESGGMRRNIIELKPRNIRELAAMIALYRPGPMEHIPKYVNNKFGRTKISLIDEKMRPILEETYGIIVYQDQVLKLVQALAGFSLGKADILRRAMGKKDVLAMQSTKIEFLEGTAANDIPNESAEKIWELLMPFAGYAFNKAHAICYAFLAYQTAYLKSNYPVEYLAGLLGVYRSKEDKVTIYVEECRRQNIELLSPDINGSEINFTIEDNKIRFGLGALKNVGDNLIQSIISVRKDIGGFKHFFEFCEYTKPFGMNRSALESLIKAGAFDSIDKNRKKLLAVSDAALAFADQIVKNKKAGQSSLFFSDLEADITVTYPELPEIEKLTKTETLQYEKEVMGIYVSDHPLRGLESQLIRLASHECAAVAELEENKSISLAGVISSIKLITTKSKGEKMGTLVLEDFSGQITAIAFPATYAKFADILKRDNIVQIRGAIVYRERFGGGERTVELRIDNVSLVDSASQSISIEDNNNQSRLLIKVPRATRKQLEDVRKLIESTTGDYGVLIQVGEDNEALPIELIHRVKPDENFLSKLSQVIPSSHAKILG